MVVANKLGDSLAELLFAVRKDYLLNQATGQEKRRQW